jgi:quercetin dioxygenase-like cupin family protein
MHRVLLLFVAFMILSAGCLTASPPEVEEHIILVAPADGISIFEGQATYIGLVGEETPQIRANYSMGHVVIPPGNATAPHRLAGTVELVYILAGEAEIRSGNGSVTAREGATVLLPEGVLQSIAAVGDADLRYITVIQPPFTPEIEVLEDDPAAFDESTGDAPIVAADPRDGTAWETGTGAAVYTLINPVLMPEAGIPIDYSVAYAELQPGGCVGYDRLNGSSDLIYVIDGEVEVSTPGGEGVRVPAGSAAFIPPDVMKMTRNSADSVTRILSFVDPAWTEGKTALWD